MDARESKFAIKLLPSLTDFAFLMPIVFLFGRMSGTGTLLADGDTGWHIRTGQWILEHGAVPRTDIFSFTKPNAPWFAWEWLTDAIWAWLHSRGGLALVSLAGALILSATFAIVFRTARRRANPIIALAATLVAAADSSLHWLARPHLFTLLFVALFCAALERVRQGRTRVGRIPILALLPLATALWTNLHGGFFVGIAMIAAYGAGEALEALFTTDPASRRPALGRARNYFLTAAGCLVASLLNPYTYHLHVHVVGYLLDRAQWQRIIEFLPLNFGHAMGVFFELLMAAGVMAAVWHVARGRFVEPLIIGMWAHAALTATRNMPIFAVAAAPLIAWAVDEWLQTIPQANVAGWLRAAARRFHTLGAETAETDAIGRWHLVSAAGVAVVAALLFAPNPPERFRAAFDPQTFPVKAVETLRGDASARIFAHDQWSDYLIYRLYPRGKVFVDGRSDFYGADFVNSATDAGRVKYGWDKTLDRFGVNTVLLPPSSPLSGALKESQRWRLTYDDGIALIFRSANRTEGPTHAVAAACGGPGRDREITKTAMKSDRAITLSTQTN